MLSKGSRNENHITVIILKKTQNFNPWMTEKE